MVTFRVKLKIPKPGANRPVSDGPQGGSRLARIGGRVNRNLEAISWSWLEVVSPHPAENSW
jgi:hypothetical protein